MNDSCCCKGCQDRKYKCHSICEKYKNFRKELDEKNAKINEEKKKEYFMYSMCERNIRHSEKKAKIKGKLKY